MSCEGDGASGSDLCAMAGRRLKVRLIASNFQTVLVVDAQPEQETATARGVIQAWVGDYKDSSTR